MKLCLKCNNNKKYNYTYCRFCLSSMLPNFHLDSFKKEYIFFYFIVNLLKGKHKLSCKVDKCVPGLRYRVDIQFQSPDGTMVLIEIDEFSHKHYDKVKETEREIKLLSQFKKVTIIRINIDDYHNKSKRFPRIWKKRNYYNSSAMYKFIGVSTSMPELQRRYHLIENLIGNVIKYPKPGYIIRMF